MNGLWLVQLLERCTMRAGGLTGLGCEESARTSLTGVWAVRADTSGVAVAREVGSQKQWS